MKISIEPLKNEYAHLIPKMIESGLNKDIFPITIFSSQGYVDYIKKILIVPEQNRRVKFYGAFVEGHLAGYTEWRVYEDSLFLNNIYVFPNFQGLGIGKSLLVNHGFKLLNEYQKSKITLDVFDDNTNAVSWYEKIGFIKKDISYWYMGEQPSMECTSCTNECYIENYPTAEAEHKLYDFSMLTCSTQNGVYQIGRIKDQFYRLPTQKCISDYSLLNCLYQFDSKRKFILLTNEEMSTKFMFNLVCISTRMNLEIL